MSEETYDSNCYDLAEHFLQDEVFPNDEIRAVAQHKLAREIQMAVESWCEYDLVRLRRLESIKGLQVKYREKYA